MASSLQFKVYDARGTYQAACNELEACAALLGAIYPGGTIRLSWSRRVLFTDGVDGDVGDSYDKAVAVAIGRIQGR